MRTKLCPRLNRIVIVVALCLCWQSVLKIWSVSACFSQRKCGVNEAGEAVAVLQA